MKANNFKKRNRYQSKTKNNVVEDRPAVDSPPVVGDLPADDTWTTPPAPAAKKFERNSIDSISEQHLPYPYMSSRVLFWRAKYLDNSPYIENIPFYFWLVESLRPQTVVEPDLNSATGYFAICQAIDKLNLNAFVYGAFGGHCNIDKVTHYNHEHYREFSTLSDESGESLLCECDDNSVDLLLLKHDSPLLQSQAWQKKLSPRGVALIHGSLNKAARKHCNQLKQRYPSFEFRLGQGLLLLCVGKERPPQIEALLGHSTDPAALRIIQDIYTRLGSANIDAWHSQGSKEALQSLQSKLEEQEQVYAHLERERQTLELRNQQLVQLEQQQIDLLQGEAELKSELNKAQQERSSLQAELSKLRAEVTTLKKANAEGDKQNLLLKQDIALRFDELAKLTSMLVDAEQQYKTLQQTEARLKAELDKEQKERASQQTSHEQRNKQFAQLEQQHKALQQTEARLKDELGKEQKARVPLQAEVEQLRQQNRLLERDQEVAANTISSLKQSELALQRSLEQRFDELAALTNLLVEAEKEHQQKMAELQTAHPEVLAEPQTQNKQAHSGVTARLKATLGAVKPRKGQAQLAKKVALIRESELFDEMWYLQQHPEAAAHRHGAAGHYLEYGAAMGANPSPRFDGNAYLQANQDVKQAGMNPLYHYINFGHDEMRLLKAI
ncbi:coiled-coil domain-containing protein [Aeromonas media]|uniref:hypothetical protein n=1 Tax=Aeromonas media TaxID=651 RepID=UPI0038D224DF